MKNVFAVMFAVVFAATISFAQTATVKSIGNDNGAYVEQAGSANVATIDQAGNKNIANAVYSPEWNVFWDSKGITQHGTGNVGSITQTGQNAAGYSQNFAAIGQMTNNNNASIAQIQTMATNQWGGITGAVEQKTGNHNQSAQYQRGWYLGSTVWQEGADNKSDVKQDGAGMGYGFAKVVQIGSGNTAGQIQSSGVSGSSGFTANVTQTGNNNTSHQNQYGTGANSSIVNQQQGSNVALTTQTFSGNQWAGQSNTITLDQLSAGNEATVVQASVGKNLAFVGKQAGGSGNYINLDQTDGVTGGSADINQNGNLNRVDGVSSLVGISHNGSTLDVDQIGTSNTLHLNQTSVGGASASVMQNGASNVATVDQH